MSVGFVDDWAKLRRRRSLGLTGRQKLAAQFAIADLHGVAVHPATTVHFGSSAGRLSRFNSAFTAARSTFHTVSSFVV